MPADSKTQIQKNSDRKTYRQNIECLIGKLIRKDRAGKWGIVWSENSPFFRENKQVWENRRENYQNDVEVVWAYTGIHYSI